MNSLFNKGLGVAPALVALLVLGLAQLLAASTARAAGDPGTWQALYGPSRNGAAGAAVLDDSRHRLISWGGDLTTTDVRVLGLDGAPCAWSILKTTGTPPAIRDGHAMVYDHNHDRLILWGGQKSGVFFHDLWQLTLGGTPTWTKISQSGTLPPPRTESASCYDAGSTRMFLYGGLDSAGSVPVPGDLYSLDLNASPPHWIQEAGSGDLPPTLFGASLAADPDSNRILLFGGNDGPNIGDADHNDTYEYQRAISTWTLIPATGNPPDVRHDQLGVWDPNNRHLLVFGGTANGGSVEDSVRALQFPARKWAGLKYYNGPSQSNLHPIGGYDTQRDQIVMLSGGTGAEPWVFWKIGAEDYWVTLAPFAARIGGSFVADHIQGRGVLFGGYDWTTRSYLNDVWTYSLTNPQGWAPAPLGDFQPPNLESPVATWDDKHNRMLVFGGTTDGGVRTNSVYALRDSGGMLVWTPITPSGTPPPPRLGMAGAYDLVGDRLLVFGGLDGIGFRTGLWQLALTPSPAWTQLFSAGGPTGRSGHSAVYDGPRHRILFFGGDDTLGNYQNETWALNLPGATWSKLTPSGSLPAGRWRHVAVFDSRRSRMLMHGGEVGLSDSTDTWELNVVPATPVWTRLSPAGTPIGARSMAAAFYDSLNDRMMEIGGVSLIEGPTPFAFGRQDVWGLQFVPGVVGVGPSPAVSPWIVGLPSPNPSRESVRLAFEIGRPTEVRAEIFDLSGRRLRVLADGVRPAGRHELAWDGRDASGRRAASGVYFYRLELDGAAVTRKVSLVR